MAQLTHLARVCVNWKTNKRTNQRNWNLAANRPPHNEPLTLPNALGPTQLIGERTYKKSLTSRGSLPKLIPDWRKKQQPPPPELNLNLHSNQANDGER